MEETKLFLITYIAALLGVVPPGLVNMTVAKTCLIHGKKNGLFVALGASIVVFIQALLAVFLARYIFDNPYIRNILLRTGFVIFLILAVYFFVKAKKGPHIEDHSKEANSNSIFKGVLIGALNVFPIPYFIALATALNIGGDVHQGYSMMIAFIFAAGLGTFTTLYFYVFFFQKIEDKTEIFAKYSNYFMGILMLVMVLITLIRIFYY